MEKPILLFIFICCLTLASNCFAQRPIDKKTEVAYYLKIYNREFNNTTFLKAWLDEFDPGYESYEDNEFKLSEKINEARSEITKLVDAVKFDKIFVGTSNLGTDGADVEFGEYNFSSNEFSFSPLTPRHTREDGLSYAINERNYFLGRTGIETADYISAEIRVKNHKDFNGLPLSKEQAEKLIERRTITNYGRSSINRDLYIKYYYSILNTKRQSPGYYNFSPKDLGFTAFVYKMEIWEDPCMMENKLLVIDAKSPVPYELTDAYNKFSADYATGKMKAANILALPSGWVNIVSSSFPYKTYDECHKSDYTVHFNIFPVSEDVFELKFMWETNACVNFRQNYMYTFITPAKIEYPLAVAKFQREVYGDVAGLVGTVKINRSTLTRFLQEGIKGIRFQLNGEPVTRGETNFYAKSPCVKMGEHKTLDFIFGDKARIDFNSKIKQALSGS